MPLYTPSLTRAAGRPAAKQTMQELHAALRLGLTPNRARGVSPRQDVTAALPSDVLPERDSLQLTAPGKQGVCAEEQALTTGMLRGIKSKRTRRVLASPSSGDSGTDDVRAAQPDTLGGVDHVKQHSGNPAPKAAAHAWTTAPMHHKEEDEHFASPSGSAALLVTPGSFRAEGALSPGSAYTDADGGGSDSETAGHETSTSTAAISFTEAVSASPLVLPSTPMAVTLDEECKSSPGNASSVFESFPSSPTVQGGTRDSALPEVHLDFSRLQLADTPQHPSHTSAGAGTNPTSPPAQSSPMQHSTMVTAWGGNQASPSVGMCSSAVGCSAGPQQQHQQKQPQAAQPQQVSTLTRHTLAAATPPLGSWALSPGRQVPAPVVDSCSAPASPHLAPARQPSPSGLMAAWLDSSTSPAAVSSVDRVRPEALFPSDSVDPEALQSTRAQGTSSSCDLSAAAASSPASAHAPVHHQLHLVGAAAGSGSYHNDEEEPVPVMTRSVVRRGTQRRVLDSSSDSDCNESQAVHADGLCTLKEQPRSQTDSATPGVTRQPTQHGITVYNADSISGSALLPPPPSQRQLLLSARRQARTILDSDDDEEEGDGLAQGPGQLGRAVQQAQPVHVPAPVPASAEGSFIEGPAIKARGQRRVVLLLPPSPPSPLPAATRTAAAQHQDHDSPVQERPHDPLQAPWSCFKPMAGGRGTRGRASQHADGDLHTDSDGSRSAASGTGSDTWGFNSRGPNSRRSNQRGRALTSGVPRRSGSRGVDVYEVASSSDCVGSFGSEEDSASSQDSKAHSDSDGTVESDSVSVRSGGRRGHAQPSQSPTHHKPALPHLPQVQPGRGSRQDTKTPGKGPRGKAPPPGKPAPPPPAIPQQQQLPTTSARGQDVLAQAQAAPARKRTRLTAEQRAFIAGRERMAAELYARWNAAVFGGRLPADLPLVWNPRLVSTAGQVMDDNSQNHAKIKKGQRIPCRLELSPKILSTEARLRTTLGHEMCHVAAWALDHEWGAPHGDAFWKWAGALMKYEAKEAEAAAEEGLPVKEKLVITRLHNFQVHMPFRWKCTNPSCGKVYSRHRTSIDTRRHVCSRCKSKLLYMGKFGQEGQLLVGPNGEKPAAAVPATPGATARQPSAYSQFVKATYSVAKAAHPPGTPSTTIMKDVAARWTSHKAQAAQQQQAQQQAPQQQQQQLQEGRAGSPTRALSFVTALTSLTGGVAAGAGEAHTGAVQQASAGRPTYSRLSPSPEAAAVTAAKNESSEGAGDMQPQAQPRQLVMEISSDDDDGGGDDRDQGRHMDVGVLSQAGNGWEAGASSQFESGTAAPEQEAEEMSQYHSFGSTHPAVVHERTSASTAGTAKQAVLVPAAAGSAHDPIHLSSPSTASGSPRESHSEGHSQESESDAGESKDQAQGLSGKAKQAAAAEAVRTPAQHQHLGSAEPGRMLAGAQQGSSRKTPLLGLMGLRERLQQLSMRDGAAAPPAGEAPQS